MDLRWWPVVQSTLHLGQRPENGQCPTGHPVRQGGLVDHGQDVGRCPVNRCLRSPHLDLRPSQATSQDRLGLQGPSVDGKPIDQCPDLVYVGAGI